MKTNAGVFCLIVLLLAMRPLQPFATEVRTGSAIELSENRRYFVDSNGRPFFWQGDTEWELFHLFSTADAKLLLRERAQQGFNVIQVMVTGVYPEWGAMKGMKPPEGAQAWSNNNPLSPDENYFKRMDAIVAAANEEHIVLVAGVYHAADNDAGRLTVLNAKAWAKWLARRYKGAKNIVWSMYPHADISSAPVIRATVQGLLEGDSGRHLITLHPDPSPTSSSFMHTEFWLSFNTLQTWSTDLMNYDMVRADYARTPAKPVIDGEARYEEEDGTTPFQVRRAGYWACLAGGFYSYGHRDNWKSPQTWRTWCHTPGAAQMRVMGDLFRSMEWWKLIPDQSIFETWVYGNVGALSADFDRIVAYITVPPSVTIKMDRIRAASAVEASWVDPKTGNKTSIGTFLNTGERVFTMPDGWEDAVLLLESHGHSLGEAYMKAGQKDLAIANYEKSLQLNPKNQGAVEKLKELKGNK